MRKCTVLALMILLVCIFTMPVSAYEPYQNYTYSTDNTETLLEPQAYTPVEIWSGQSTGAGSFSNPEDIYVSPTRKIYVTDTANNRVVIFDEKYKFIRSIEHFDNNGKVDGFSSPKGVFEAQNENLYIADTENGRIVVLDKNDKLVRIYGAPETPMIEAENFKPQKLVVDFTYRMFIVSAYENKGLISIDKDGDFTGFFGAVKTPTTLYDIFKVIATRQQRETMAQMVPVVYSNVDIDPDSFVYTSVSMVDVNVENYSDLNTDIFVRKLNPMGNDVLYRRGTVSIIGDVNVYKSETELEVSNLCDIAYDAGGIYSVLGQRYGRIFTYDGNGNLLFVFGSKGTSFGQFSQPVALDTLDDNILVLDRNYNHIVVFKSTQYGNLIRQASAAYNERRYDDAEKLYDEMLTYTVNSDVAYKGKGNCLLHKEEYKEAMKYFKLCDNKDLYIEAFKYYREEIMNKYFGVAMTSIIIVVSGVLVYGFCRKRLKTIRRKK